MCLLSFLPLVILFIALFLCVCTASGIKALGSFVSMLCGCGVADLPHHKFSLELLIVEICSSKIVNMPCGCGVTRSFTSKICS